MNGIVININPVIFQLGGFELRWYSLAVLAAVLAALLIAVHIARRKGIPPAAIYSAAPWVLLGGILGARLFHVLDHLSYYLAHPAQVMAIQQGGLAIWGALIGGGLALVVYARSARLNLAVLSDLLMPALLVGQIIGRLGCIVNGDAAGGLTSLPWGFIYTNPAAMVPPGLLGVPTHPYPVYEMLWNGLSLVLIWRVSKRTHKNGSLFAVYLALYALGRIVLTTVRQETVLFWGLQEAQVLALGAFALAALIIVRLNCRREVLEGANG
jgi:phosphatidylglycerol:prolipoprotein diacylglycerol transferase